MRGVGLVILAAVLTVTFAQTRNASIQCFDFADKYQMVLDVYSNGDPDFNFIYALNSSGLKSTACSSDTVPSPFVNQTNGDYQLVVDVNKATLSANQPCEHTNISLDFTWRFLTTQFANVVVKSTDVLFVARCNFSAASQTEVSTSAVVTGSNVENLAEDTSRTFQLNLIPNGGGAALSSVNIGDMVQLQIVQLTGDSAVISGYSCSASPDNTFGVGNDFQLIESNGCPTEYGVSNTRVVASGFTGVLGSAVSGAFEQFRFTTSTSVHYQCTVTFCLSGNNGCVDFCSSNSGRRKRQAEESEDVIETTQIRISFVPTNLPQVNNTAQVCPATTQVSSCLNNVGVIAAFAVLACLLLVTIAVAIAVFVRSVRLSDAGHHPEKPKL